MLEARGKGKTHRSCGAVIKKILLVMGRNYRYRERTNQKWKLHRSYTQTKRGQPKLVGMEQTDKQTHGSVPFSSEFVTFRRCRLAHNTHIN